MVIKGCIWGRDFCSDSLSVITSETGLRRCSRYALQSLHVEFITLKAGIVTRYKRYELSLITHHLLFYWRGYVIRDSEHIARIINPRDWEFYFDL